MVRVYNIRKSTYADSLRASGVANRWNKDDEFVIYTGGSISLSALELIAHLNTADFKQEFKLLTIDVDVDAATIPEIKPDSLPSNWKSVESYPELQKMGSNWYRSSSHLLLKVPSALIPQESNYLINTSHPDFAQKVSVYATKPFIWDERLR